MLIAQEHKVPEAYSKILKFKLNSENNKALTVYLLVIFSVRK